MKLLSIIEGTTVNGPAKNLLKFCRLMRSPEFCADGIPRIDVSIVTFHRPAVSESRAVATGSYGSSFVFDPIATAPGSDTALVATARELDITVDVITERFRFDPQVLPQLREIIAQRAPDIIQTHMIKSHFLAKLSGLTKTYPWVAYHHGYTTTDLKMRAYNQLDRWSLPSAARVITVCAEFARDLTQSGVQKERIAVRHNAVIAPRNVTSDEQQRLRDRLRVGNDERVVLAVGRLSREKGHADLIYAMSVLRELDSELRFKLLIVGEGPEQANLSRAVTERNLASQVVFVGHVTDVAPFYAIADVLALPSHSEGSPNVLLEAMAAGVPVVATSVGGVPEIATTEENALLVASHDPQTFASAMHRVLSDETLAKKLAANGRERVANDFSPQSHARSLIKIYEEVTVPRAITSGSYNSSGLLDPVATAPGSDTSL
jgi:glycosyltransferase involved in cell wall biosynthesis